MSQENNNQVLSLRAGDTLTAYKVVGIAGAANTVNLVITSTSAILGVTADGADSGSAIPVIVSGTTKVEVGANVTLGNVVAPLTDGAGTITPIGTHNTSTSEVMPALGVALESGSVGSVIEVMLQPCNQVLR